MPISSAMMSLVQPAGAVVASTMPRLPEPLRLSPYGVDDYLTMCEEKDITPEQPFKGSFNVRVGRDLHRQIALEAARRGVSLNSLIVAALEKETHHAA